MGTLYVTNEDAFIGKVDERLIVKSGKQKLSEVRLIDLDGVVVLGRATVSPALVYELLERHISLSLGMRSRCLLFPKSAEDCYSNPCSIY